MAGGDSLLAPGKGDPEAVAGRAGLGDLADQVATALKGRGTRRVTLFVDETYAAGPTTAPTWAPTFRSSGITGAVAMLGLSSQRARGGAPVRPTPSPRCGRPSSACSRPVASTCWSRLGTGPRVLRSPMPTPTRSGDAVGDARRRRHPGRSGPRAADADRAREGPGAVLGSVQSAPVREQLALALTDSDNALTEILARQAAYRSGAGTGFAAVGSWVVSQVAALGLDTAGVTLSDASGLSRENRVRASLLSDVLVLGYDGKHPVLRRALDGLPIGGLTGTLAERFSGAQPRRGRPGPRQDRHPDGRQRARRERRRRQRPAARLRGYGRRSGNQRRAGGVGPSGSGDRLLRVPLTGRRALPDTSRDVDTVTARKGLA